MKRRDLLILLGGAVALRPMAATGQSKVLHVGVLGDPSPELWQVFTEALRARGWIEGQSLVFDIRSSDDQPERYPQLASELVARRPNLVIAVSYRAAKAVHETTKTIPIVFIQVPNPVGLGLVASLAQPGGNVTGISGQAEDIIGKGLQLIKETRPGISRLAYLVYGEPLYLTRTQQIAAAAAAQLGLSLTMIAIESATDFEPAFAQIRRERPDALVVSSVPLFVEDSKEIAAFAIDQRLPSFTFSAAMARDGLLLAQSADIVGAYRSAAAIVHKILKGAKPADIPVEQPTRFHLVVNLKTARAIGLEIPPALLALADEVIE
jgi:putative ABC transport system substrate-binding protein